jgi:hypothetical protein
VPEASSEARNRTVLATSSASPSRPRDSRSIISKARRSSSMAVRPARLRARRSIAARWNQEKSRFRSTPSDENRTTDCAVRSRHLMDVFCDFRLGALNLCCSAKTS